MTWPTGRSWAASENRSRYALSAAGALLAASILLVPPASATPPSEVTGAAGSVVESATGAPPPSVPLTAPAAPSTPPVPPVQVPVDPVPTEAAPPPSHSAPSAVTTEVGAKDGVSAVEGMASAAGEQAAAATGSPAEAASPVPADSAHMRSGDARPAPGSAKQRLRLTEADPVRWFLAYVWPAVALEGHKDPFKALIAGLRMVAPLPLSEAAATASSSGPRGGARAGSPSSPAQQIGRPASTSEGHSLAATLAEGAKTLLYAAAAALLALFAFTAWAELRAAIRSRGVTDRWHRGF